MATLQITDSTMREVIEELASIFAFFYSFRVYFLTKGSQNILMSHAQ